MKPTIQLENHKGERVDVEIDSEGDLALEWWSESEGRFISLFIGSASLPALTHYLEEHAPADES